MESLNSSLQGLQSDNQIWVVFKLHIETNTNFTIAHFLTSIGIRHKKWKISTTFFFTSFIKQIVALEENGYYLTDGYYDYGDY